MSKGKDHRDSKIDKYFSQEEVVRYLKGQMSNEDRHELEKEALDSEFYTEAMEGLESFGTTDLENDFQKLRSRLAQRVEKKERRVIPLWLRVAAGIAVLAIGTFSVINVFDLGTTKEAQLALQEEAASPAETEQDDFVENSNTRADASDTSLLESDALAYNREPEEKKSTKFYNLQRDEKPTQTTKKEESRGASVVTLKPQEPVVIEEEEEMYAEEVLELEEAVVPEPTADEIATGNDVASAQYEAEFEDAAVEKSDKLERAKAPKKEKKSDKRKKSKAGKYKAEAITETAEAPALSKVETKDADGAAQEAPLTTSATPVNGMNSFKEYVDKNLNYPEQARQAGIEGEVTVRFFVEKDGALSGLTIKESLGYGCDEEAVRLIEKGPKWKPATENNNPVRREVNVEIRFKLDQ